MIDVLLITPQLEMGGRVSTTKWDFAPPIGTLSIASFIENQGFSVKLIDTRLYEHPTNEILKFAKDARIIGLSVMTCQIEHALIISKAIKEKFPDKIIVWGGVHASLFPEQTIAHPLVDYVIVGEGEKALLRLLKKAPPKKSILRAEMLTSDEMPKLNYELVDIERYLPSKYEGKIYRKIDYPTSRGCLYRCTFCINVVLWNRNYRILPAERVLDEIEDLIEKYKLTAVWFTDEDMFANKVRMKKILEGMISRKINIIWKTNNRVSYFRDDYINDNFMELLYQSGCRELGHGIESGSERVRGLIKKDITEEQVLRSAYLYNKYKIRPEYSFMCALPTETKKEFYETLNLIDKIRKICPSAVILGPQSYRPYRGGELYNLAIKLGFKAPNTLTDWIKESNAFTSSVMPDKFPWVSKRMAPVYENVGKYATLATRTFDQVWNLSKLMVVPWAISRLRWKARFFKYPVDWELYKAVTKLMPFY
jgi:anaerobic magnesium-protoporphyrin IX monomethyl ester cyclase